MSYIGKIPEGLHFTKEHEWVKIEGDLATVGITDYAQHALTDVVFVELPQPGKKTEQMKPFCVIESVKSVSDVFAPMSGEVTDVNTAISNAPEHINQDPYEKGWIAKIKITTKDEAANLMDPAAYKKFLAGLD